jgi:hypothetical protein
MQPTAPLLINVPEHPATRTGGVVLRLTVEAAMDAGLRDGQVIKGTLTEDFRRLSFLTGDGRFLSLPFNGSAYKSASSWFRVEFSPYGVYLKAAAPAVSSTDISVPEATLPTLPEFGKTPYLRSLSWLLSLGGPQEYQQLVQRLLAGAASDRQLFNLARELVLRSETVSPLAIFTALRQSGLFSQSKSNLQPDLRRLLGLLASSENKTVSTDFDDPDDLLQVLGSRLDAAQLEALHARAAGEFCFRFPLLFEDQVPAEVIFKRSRGHQGNDGWSLDLELYVAHGLRLSFCCLLLDQHCLTVSAWVPDPDFANQMRNWVQVLDERLQEFGMELRHWVIYPHTRSANLPPDGQSPSFECRI